MKKYFLFIALALFYLNAWTCDVCGAMNNSMGLGTIGQGNRSSIGFNYQFRSYATTHLPLFNEAISYSSEHFQKVEINGALRISERWQFKTVIPYVWNSQRKEGSRFQISGLGDWSVSTSYFLIDWKDSTGKNNFRSAIGGGIKLPIGAFAAPHNEQFILFPGTGTVDALIQCSNYLKRNYWQFSAELAAIIRSSNRYGYTPGSVFNAAVFSQRSFKNKTIFTGFQYAYNGNDYLNRLPISDSPTQGSLLSIVAGATVQWNSFLIQGNVHIPLIQSLGGKETHQKNAINISLTYLF